MPVRGVPPVRDEWVVFGRCAGPGALTLLNRGNSGNTRGARQRLCRHGGGTDVDEVRGGTVTAGMLQISSGTIGAATW